ncbi:MAG: acyl-CoA dehydrogenase [Desulfobacula sp.]|jgi:alkylation response protein AidB-like acyl-CoA dehydrogenase|uniref:acyl-CoA dehydrogenase n=1 Tax=Desulfobacula sp. TaxID=2593537 RepID=UPI001D685782|nr:acyl-CoA dehydrogenase [Desulfobacula sp.]MBT3486861.1 acyl-CoA dehydrogenase [Desulfobacula sp.]MBT3805985.1 acyl-CoA dehydrogenase [Desulfobacula sp.]MBT4026892.1 acyl-CoA dehydrogenase [Desulfobacula sp.]MBT4200797.1 acyl-CoA dehydrogenase [Desulfobacula sp.]
MPIKISDQRDIDFVLYEQFKVDEFLKLPKYQAFNKKMFDMVIKEAKNLAVKEIFPTYTQCDKEGVTFENGTVRVPECLRKPHQLLVEGEWSALTENPEYGGQGLPFSIAQAALEYVTCANYVLTTYLILSHGAGKMIDLFGTAKQKELFLEKLYTGVWGGTMLLTEPGAGSDVGALTTSAKKLDDGTYEITGSKIFITNGEQNLTENIIHPVLARIEGAPAGTKGISLFIVPKIWVNKDGTLGELNDVVCTGVEEKMGIHGSPTCSLSLGSKGKCRGFLLGTPNRGMQIMFHMMNEVRLEVGTQAFASANLAYLHALDYAKQRLQGRSIEKIADHGASQVPIIRHPDVKRMLLKMKSYVEGIRSLLYYVAYCFDKKENAIDKKEARDYSNIVEILTPVVKAYSSEKGFDVCVEAMQIFGGYGYTKEYPVEQMVRDCKIASIYEGSNGIQAMDFLGRKIIGDNGAMLDVLVREIQSTILTAKDHENLNGLALKLEVALILFEDTCKNTGHALLSKHMTSAFACAHPLMEAAGDIIIAWMLLWRANISITKLDTREKNFYHGKIKTAQFFITTIIPATIGKLTAITYENNPAASMEESLF